MPDQGRRVAVASISLVVASTIMLLVVGAPGARAANASAEDELAAATDSSRAAAGLSSLSWTDDLASVAARQAGRMAARGAIYHNPNLATEVTGWQQVGENVGVGANADQLHEAFMNSPRHRENILSTVYTEVGFGTAIGNDGRLYVAEVFRLPDLQAEPAADQAAPEPVAVSQPVPSPPLAPQSPAPEIQVRSAVAAVQDAGVHAAAAPVVHRATYVMADERPRLVASFRALPPVPHHPLSLAVWMAALLAQAVLIIHMCVFWKRYKMGSGW